MVSGDRREPAALSRREALRRSLGLAALALGARTEPAGAAGVGTAGGGVTRERPAALRDAARSVADWLHAVQQETAAGLVWPVAPDVSGDVAWSLYTGTPGVVLFHLELYDAMGDADALAVALAGADALAAGLPAGPAGVGDAGLYTGLAGVAWTLAEAARAGGRHAPAAERAFGLLRDAAEPAGAGVQWSETTDIIGGGAGIALALLWHAQQTGAAASLDVALKAGRRLVEVATRTAHGLDWHMRPDFPRRMPNFSHGTAGVAYALASLYATSGDAVMLDAALAGASHLRAIARSDDGFRVHHHDGGGEDLFYLSWCHGPPGTARLFHRLHGVTADAGWARLVRDCARATMASGIPERRTPGFWNNVSACCGNAGVSQFFLDLHADGDRAEDRAFADRCTADLLRRGTDAEPGLKWVQAEHRVRPDDVVAQTGLMQGAAGIGLLLLRHDGIARGRRPRIVAPDSPFAG